MRILWHGVNHQFKTGYANQTNLFTPALVNAGHEVAINAILSQYNTGIDGNGIVNYANGPRNQFMGNDLLLSHVKAYKPDIVISMTDPFVCKPEVFDKVNWYPFVMVDSDPYSWENMEALKAAKKPISPTRHAQKVLADAGMDSFYCPLAIDTDTFKPIDRDQARQEVAASLHIDLADKFFVVMNSANHSSPSRKNFGAAFKAWAMFQKDHPDAVLYVHAEVTGTMYLGGEDLQRIIDLYGCTNVYFPPQYDYWSCTIPASWLNTLYNAADVFLHTARGEGFGLPIVEAQAAGCPVIVPGFGAMAENCFTGEWCKGMRWMYHSGAEQYLVDVDSVVNALRSYCVRPVAQSFSVSEQVQNFDIKRVMADHMLPMLEEIAADLCNTKTQGEPQHEERQMAGKADSPALVIA